MSLIDSSNVEVSGIFIGEDLLSPLRVLKTRLKIKLLDDLLANTFLEVMLGG